MNPSADAREKAARLRAQAQAHLRARPSRRATRTAKGDAPRLLQELQIHQIELELQNEELKLAKIEVEAGLEKYTDLYEFAPVGYFTLSADGAVRLVNITGAGLLGLERSRLIGRPFGRLVVAGQRVEFEVFLKEVFGGPAKRTRDFDLLDRDQLVRTVNIDAQRLPNEQECRAVVVDITEHKRAEEMVRISEIRYRRIFEAAHDGVLLLNAATGRITDANPFMTILLGYPRDRLIGMQLFEIGLLRDETASREMFQKLKRTHEVRYETLPLESRDGRHQEVEVVASLYVENGRPVIQCNIRDITERKRAEEMLRRNEALFSALVAQVPVGVYVVDSRFRLQQANPKALVVFSQVDSLFGRDFSEVLHIVWPRRTADEVVARFRHTLETGEPYQTLEFSERRRDIGVKETYEWQIQRVTLPAGEPAVVCYFTDITERKRAEGAQRRMDMLTATNRQLEAEIVRRQAVQTALKLSEQHAHSLLGEAQRMQEELRQVSRRILGAQEDLRRKISRELHDDISQLLVGINVHLAIFAKAAALDPKGVQRTVAPLRRLVDRSLTIVHKFSCDLRPAVLDDFGLIPALRAYLNDFPTQPGRKIHFTAFAGVEALDNDKRTVLYRIAQESLTNVHKHARARVVKLSIHKARDGVCLEVVDDGKAFVVDDYSATKQGSHLGLIGMRERVEMVGGKFSVESVPGQGTTVRAEIPFAGNGQRA